jgi:hypothetical protein
MIVCGNVLLQFHSVIIQTIKTCHVETVVCLSNKNARSKDYIEIGLDVEDYYRIKDSAGADKCGGAEEDE